MVEPRELRQMGNLDIEKTRDDAQAEKASESTVEAQQAESSKSTGDEPLENASVPPLRPLTRSLTGRASKPRARDDSWYQPPKKSLAARKKPVKSPRKRTIDEVDKAESEEPQDPPPPPPPAPEPAVPPLNGTQAVFVDVSSDPLLASPFDTRARVRTNLPVPVPNLIKKSRGRRVPVVAAETSGNGNEDANKRLHICKVEGCGKCFHRGEHLKRHIRSIHTHEKPFPCTFPSCHKFFNRHDNLLQHIKVHRNGDDDVDAEGSPAPEDSPPPSPTTHDSFSGNATSSRVATMVLQQQQQQSTAIMYHTLTAPRMMSSQSSSYATNMAVSSLRTELPDSPVKGGIDADADADETRDGDADGQPDDIDVDAEHEDDEEVPPAVPAPPAQPKQYIFVVEGADTHMQQQAQGGQMQMQMPIEQQQEHYAQPQSQVVRQVHGQPQSYYRLRTPPPPPRLPPAQETC
ncbi:hypothetical protein B0H12DRAFT_131676 [Mycena haematopus]|nr:hypothetical protein B0H12DRAFT_131676 [Mycena haematopus]